MIQCKIHLGKLVLLLDFQYKSKSNPNLTLRSMFQQIPLLKFQDENHLEANPIDMLDDLSDGLTPMEDPQFETFTNH